VGCSSVLVLLVVLLLGRLVGLGWEMRRVPLGFWIEQGAE
jgi:hypothetical protein